MAYYFEMYTLNRKVGVAAIDRNGMNFVKSKAHNRSPDTESSAWHTRTSTLSPQSQPQPQPYTQCARQHQQQNLFGSKIY